MKSLYEDGGEGCPYDSVHRAKAAMIHLNVAFSKMLVSKDSSNASLGSTAGLYHTTGHASSAPKLRRGAGDATMSKENANPNAITAGLTSDSDFSDLTVPKLMELITLNSAVELRGK